MGGINREWHEAHRMPPRATVDQRGQWHSEHVDECSCRAPSAKEQELIDRWCAQHPRASAHTDTSGTALGELDRRAVPSGGHVLPLGQASGHDVLGQFIEQSGLDEPL